MSKSDDEMELLSTKVVQKPAPKRKSVKYNQGSTYRGKGGDGDDYLPRGSGIGGIFAYLRRSAEDRTHRPLQTQVDVIDRYVDECLKVEGGNVRAYFGDNGISGSAPPERRDGMRELFNALNKASDEIGYGSIHVVVYDASRLARSVAVGSRVKSMLEKIGATLHLAQNRMIVQGANADLFFGLNLQLAASERTSTISRVRASMRSKKDWDPRKSYGWRYEGKGVPPSEIPEEQEILERIKFMFENEGILVVDIVKTLNREVGPRRCRQIDSEIDTVEWNGTDISFLAKKHNWRWGGGRSREDLEDELEIARSRNKTVEQVMADLKGEFYDGVKINRSVVRMIMLDELPPWHKKSIGLARQYLKAENYSNDDIIDMLNENAPFHGDAEKQWTRQTAWRVINLARKLNDREKRKRAI